MSTQINANFWEFSSNTQHDNLQVSEQFKPFGHTKLEDCQERGMNILAQHCSMHFLDSVFSLEASVSLPVQQNCSVSKIGLLSLVAYACGGLDLRIKALHEPFRHILKPALLKDLCFIEALACNTLLVLQPSPWKKVSRNMMLDSEQLDKIRRHKTIPLWPITAVSQTDEPVHRKGNVNLVIETPQGIVPGEFFSDTPEEELAFLIPGGYLKIQNVVFQDLEPFQSTPLPSSSFPRVTLHCEHYLPKQRAAHSMFDSDGLIRKAV